MNLNTLRLRSPADVVSAIPYLIGFHPADSIVVLVCDNAQGTCAMRLDLNAHEALLEHIADLVARRRPEAVILAGYGAAGRVTPVIERLRDRLREREVCLRDALRVEGGRFWSYLCSDLACCPADGTYVDVASSPVTAAAIAAGLVARPDRRDLERTLEPVGGDAMREAVFRAESAFARWSEPAVERPAEPGPSAGAEPYAGASATPGLKPEARPVPETGAAPAARPEAGLEPGAGSDANPAPSAGVGSGGGPGVGSGMGSGVGPGAGSDANPVPSAGVGSERGVGSRARPSAGLGLKPGGGPGTKPGTGSDGEGRVETGVTPGRESGVRSAAMPGGAPRAGSATNPDRALGAESGAGPGTRPVVDRGTGPGAAPVVGAVAVPGTGAGSEPVVGLGVEPVGVEPVVGAVAVPGTGVDSEPVVGVGMELGFGAAMEPGARPDSAGPGTKAGTGTGADGVPARMVLEGVPLVCRVIEQARAGAGLPSDDEVAWLGVLLTSLRVRDEAWVRMNDQHLEAHLLLWRNVLTRLPEEYAAAPACLLSFAAWRMGDGALANIALDRALTADPHYTMARLLQELFISGLPPWSLPMSLTPDELDETG